MATYDVTAFGSALEFDTTQADQKYVLKMTDTRFVIIWIYSIYTYAQCFEINRTTGVITALSSKITINLSSQSFYSLSLTRINDTKFIAFWVGIGNDGYCRTFQINESTGEITTWGSQIEYNGANAYYHKSEYITEDGTNAYIILVHTDGTDNYIYIFQVSLSTGTITSLGETDIGSFPTNFSISRISNTEFLITYSNNSDLDGFARIISVNNSTWGVTARTAFEWLNLSTINQNSCEIMSASPLIALNAFDNNSNFGIRPLSINNSTWAITNLGSATTNISTVAQSGEHQQKILFRIDDTHFIVFYTGADSDGYVRTYSLNQSDGSISLISTLEFDTTNGTFMSGCNMGDGIFICAWTGADSDGYVQSFKVELTVSTNFQINIGDSWKTVESIQINIGDSWKEVTNAQINIGDTWKTIY